jgi:hypothetical protein
MKCMSRSCLWMLALGALAASPANAQVVRGEVRDEERGRPLAGARLLLLGPSGAPVDSAVADAAGRFRLLAPTSGEYVIFFQLDGWASVPSNPLKLESGATTDFRFDVPLIASEALREMSDIIAMEPRLQEALPEICGEAFRPWEAGLLVGRVRSRATGEPVAGARVAVAPNQGGAAVRSTVSTAKGVYILCNVPVGTGIPIVTESPEGVTDTTRVEIRAGSAAWYDLMVSGRR